MREVATPTTIPDPVRDQNKYVPDSPADCRAEAKTEIRMPTMVPIVLERSQAWRVRSMALSGASLALIAIIATGLIWAAIAKVPITAIAQGKIAPVGRVQVVAHAEGGAVRALNVRVGQRVRAGNILIELDPTTANADLKQFDDELMAHEAAIRRLEAEQLDQTPDFRGLPPKLAQSEMTLFFARQVRYSAELAAAKGELENAEAGFSGAVAALRPLRERLEGRKKLAETGFGSRFNVLEDEAKIAELMGRQAAGQASRKIAMANIDGLQYRREEEIAKGLIEHRNLKAERNQARPKIVARLENLSVVAPLDGIVKSISVTGPGAVLKPGEALAEIVPETGERLVVARLPAANIGHVHPGQSAQMTLIPADMHFKPIVGTVKMLAPDSVADERTGQLSFIVHIKPDSDRFSARDSDATYLLLDGVPVSVTIVTGERTVLGLLVGPLFSGLEEALGAR